MFKKNILIIGVGSIGSNLVRKIQLVKNPSIRLSIIDRDVVDASNLKTCPEYKKSDIGVPKADIISGLYDGCDGYCIDINDTTTFQFIKTKQHPDIIVDCTDNFQARMSINRLAKEINNPLIHSAASAEIGVVYSKMPEHPCLECLYGPDAIGLDCNNLISQEIIEWVTNEIVSEILEILKLNFEKHSSVSDMKKFTTKKRNSGTLLRYSSISKALQKISINKNPNCETCYPKHKTQKGLKSSFIELCGKNQFMFRSSSRFQDMIPRLKKIAEIKAKSKSALIAENITIFKDQRIIIRAKNQRKALDIFYLLTQESKYNNIELTHDYCIKKCKTGIYKAKPNYEMSKDFCLKRCSGNSKIILNTPPISVISTPAVGEVIISSDCELSFKDCRDINKIESFCNLVFTKS